MTTAVDPNRLVVHLGNRNCVIELEGIAWLTEKFTLTTNAAKRAVFGSHEKALITLDILEQMAEAKWA